MTTRKMWRDKTVRTEACIVVPPFPTGEQGSPGVGSPGPPGPPGGLSNESRKIIIDEVRVRSGQVTKVLPPLGGWVSSGSVTSFKYSIILFNEEVHCFSIKISFVVSFSSHWGLCVSETFCTSWSCWTDRLYISHSITIAVMEMYLSFQSFSLPEMYSRYIPLTGRI